MSSADHTPSAAPIPPELAALDFDPSTDLDDAMEERACDALVELTRREVALRIELAAAMRRAAESEAEYLAAATEEERRTWREHARAEALVARRTSLELHCVLVRRSCLIRELSVH